jgi:hypothetical protein
MLCGNFIDGGRRLIGGKYLGCLGQVLNQGLQVNAQVVHRTSRAALLGANVLLEGVIMAVLFAAVADNFIDIL